jgi:hypothetical protein
MLDHVGIPIADYARSKAFYEKALAPLGYALVWEVPQTGNGEKAAGFGTKGKPDFWIGSEGGLNRSVHIAILAKDRATVDAFYRAALAAGGKDNGAPAITRIITALSSSIPTATISKRSATRPHVWRRGSGDAERNLQSGVGGPPRPSADRLHLSRQAARGLSDRAWLRR